MNNLSISSSGQTSSPYFFALNHITAVGFAKTLIRLEGKYSEAVPLTGFMGLRTDKKTSGRLWVTPTLEPSPSTKEP